MDYDDLLKFDPSLAPEESSVSHFDNHLGYWLHFVAHHVSERMDQLLGKHGVAMNDWLILRTTFQDPGVPYYAVVRLLGLGRTGCWKAVQRLERRGLIHCELMPGEARCKQLSLTAKGEAMVPALAALAEDNEFHFFSRLPPGVPKALAGALQEVATRHHFGNRHVPRRPKNLCADRL
jgi:DNA-binding MarR family transcriptional regulator